MFALVATSMAGPAKKEKRGLLPGAAFAGAGYAGAGYAGAGLAGAGYAAGPSFAIPSYAAPLAAQIQNTHSVERVNVPLPYPVERTIVKTVGVDRPVPQVNIIPC